jgi:hypothetical protein
VKELTNTQISNFMDYGVIRKDERTRRKERALEDSVNETRGRQLMGRISKNKKRRLPAR